MKILEERGSLMDTYWAIIRDMCPMLVEIDGVVEVLTERSESGKGTFITSFFHGRDLIAKVNMIQLTKTPRMSGLFDTFREVSS